MGGNDRETECGTINEDVLAVQLLAQTSISHKCNFMKLWLFGAEKTQTSSFIVMFPACSELLTTIYPVPWQDLTCLTCVLGKIAMIIFQFAQIRLW